jgi:hypothetical protein
MSSDTGDAILHRFARDFYSYVVDYSVEICANISTDNDFVLTDVVSGKDEQYTQNSVVKTRQTCTLSRYSHYIFHSHPLQSRAYPSAEDILKVLKNRHIIIQSYISTSWGVWIISNTSTSNGYSDASRHSWLELLTKKTSDIGKHTPHDTRYPHIKSPPLNHQTRRYIQRKISEIESATNLRIELREWSEINKN